MALARTAWGIDVGNRALKAVKLVREGDGVRIDDYDVIEHEHVLSNAGDNRESLIQNSLAQFAQNHPVKGIPVAVGVSGQSSFARFVKLPPVERRQIPSIVKFEAIQQIPFPLDEVEWSYQLFEDEGSPDIEVGIFAMKKDLVNQHIKYFTDAGLNVQAVQMNPLSVYNAMRYDERVQGTTMIIDLGAENADLIIAEGETIWLRSIPIGGNNFTEALTKAFKLRFEKAEEMKRNAATSKYGRQILQAMRPIFADLVSEIQRSIGFYSSVHRDSRITRVVALGGTFKLPGLQKYLQQNLQLDVQKIDMLGNNAPTDGKVAAALSENILSSPGAYGLALQALGSAKIDSSLLPQAIRREKLWKEKNKWFALAAACFVAGTGVSFAKYHLDQGAYNKAEGVRQTIATTLDQGKRLSDQWKELQDKGGPDRKRIMDVKNMTDWRDIQAQLVADIEASLPKVANETGPRGQRRQIVIEDLAASYTNQLPPAEIPDPEFDRLAAPRTFYVPGAEAGTRAVPGQQGQWQRSGGGSSGSGSSIPMPSIPIPGMPAMPGMPGVTPVAPAAPVADAPAGSGKRGYLLTLHTTTPNSGGSRHVQETFMAELQRRAPKVVGPSAKKYWVPRITLPKVIQFGDDPVRAEMMKLRDPGGADRGSRGSLPITPPPGYGAPMPYSGASPFIPGGANNAAASGMPPMPPDAATPPGTPGAPGTSGAPSTPGTPAAPGTPAVAPAAEDLSNDWDVTLLVAVELIDPAAAAAPAEAEGGG